MAALVNAVPSQPPAVAAGSTRQGRLLNLGQIILRRLRLMPAFAVACTPRGSLIELMPDERRYRLTDAAMQPHSCLDVDYPSLQEALDCYQASIGVEVSTERGDWRTLMLLTDIQQLDLISKG